jgi:hypothetical protein
MSQTLATLWTLYGSQGPVVLVSDSGLYFSLCGPCANGRYWGEFLNDLGGGIGHRVDVKAYLPGDQAVWQKV